MWRSLSSSIDVPTTSPGRAIVARPFMYGLAINGEQGVEEVLRGLLADTEITMGLSGYSSLKEIWARKEKFMRKVDSGLV